MLWKWATVFLGLTSINMFFYAIIFWILEKTPTKSFEIFKHSFVFSSNWTFWGGVVLVLLPCILIANYLVLMWYYLGYTWLAQSEKIWQVQIMWWGSGPISFIALSYFWRNELPTKGNLVGFLLCIAGMIISKFWR